MAQRTAGPSHETAQVSHEQRRISQGPGKGVDSRNRQVDELCAAGLSGLQAQVLAVALAAANRQEGVRDVAVHADLLLETAGNGFGEGHEVT